MWHGYIVVERGTVGAVNWAALRELFEDMGTHKCPYPCWNNHDKERLDGNAVIYESRFQPDEVSIGTFKQLLAETFEIDVEDIEHTTATVYYTDIPTTVWEFLYSDIVRFTARRFGQGGGRMESRDACWGYVAENIEEWEEVQ